MESKALANNRLGLVALEVRPYTRLKNTFEIGYRHFIPKWSVVQVASETMTGENAVSSPPNSFF